MHAHRHTHTRAYLKYTSTLSMEKFAVNSFVHLWDALSTHDLIIRDYKVDEFLNTASLVSLHSLDEARLFISAANMYVYTAAFDESQFSMFQTFVVTLVITYPTDVHIITKACDILALTLSNSYWSENADDVKQRLDQGDIRCSRLVDAIVHIATLIRDMPAYFHGNIRVYNNLMLLLNHFVYDIFVSCKLPILSLVSCVTFAMESTMNASILQLGAEILAKLLRNGASIGDSMVSILHKAMVTYPDDWYLQYVGCTFFRSMPSGSKDTISVIKCALRKHIDQVQVVYQSLEALVAALKHVNLPLPCGEECQCDQDVQVTLSAMRLYGKHASLQEIACFFLRQASKCPNLSNRTQEALLSVMVHTMIAYPKSMWVSLSAIICMLSILSRFKHTIPVFFKHSYIEMALDANVTFEYNSEIQSATFPLLCAYYIFPQIIAFDFPTLNKFIFATASAARPGHTDVLDGLYCFVYCLLRKINSSNCTKYTDMITAIVDNLSRNRVTSPSMVLYAGQAVAKWASYMKTCTPLVKKSVDCFLAIHTSNADNSQDVNDGVTYSLAALTGTVSLTVPLAECISNCLTDIIRKCDNLRLMTLCLETLHVVLVRCPKVCKRFSTLPSLRTVALVHGAEPMLKDICKAIITFVCKHVPHVNKQYVKMTKK